jgi:hypothetical protein
MVLINEKTANAYGLTHFAAAANKVEVLESLLSAGARLDTDYEPVEYNILYIPSFGMMTYERIASGLPYTSQYVLMLKKQSNSYESVVFLWMPLRVR